MINKMENQYDILSLFKRLKKYLSADSVVSMPQANQCVVFKLNYAHKNIFMSNRSPDVLLSIQAVLDILWEDLNIGHWSQVPEKIRSLYSLASLFKVIRLVQEITFETGCPRHGLEEAVKAADMGLLMGCGYQEQLAEAARTLTAFLSQDDERSEGGKSLESEKVESGFKEGRDGGSDVSTVSMLRLQICRELIPSLSRPSLEHFYKNHFLPHKPLKLLDCVEHWPARRKWSNIDYLVKLAGPRLVPVELGSAYTHQDWGQKLIPFKEFVEKFIFSKGNKIGYLAQHQLFDQIPELKKDIYTPEYCCLSEDEGEASESAAEEGEVEINAWFGPAGTVSPLHYDPKHNLLTQVVGRKHLLLYPPEDSERLYPHEEAMLQNTARVDPYNPDFQAFPKFEGSTAYECLLNPGEMVYIPPKWWHHVRSLDTSFSVSFWWK